MTYHDEECRCAESDAPVCSEHARARLMRAHARMAVAIRGCDSCKPTQPIRELAAAIATAQRDWEESVEARFVAAAIIEALPDGPTRTRLVADLARARRRRDAKDAGSSRQSSELSPN
ncbi:MAG: hypothetical protein Q7T55_22395 [Solirubrobacteraceae bacterium]|nr:hypothetical protein [Solirubrobacteraceae bacterium]